MFARIVIVAGTLSVFFAAIVRTSSAACSRSRRTCTRHGPALRSIQSPMDHFVILADPLIFRRDCPWPLKWGSRQPGRFAFLVIAIGFSSIA